MTTISFDLRDLIWFATLLVTITLAYSRVRSELRHLDDTKADRTEVQAFMDDIRTRLEEIRTSVIRVEEALRQRSILPQPPVHVPPDTDE